MALQYRGQSLFIHYIERGVIAGQQIRENRIRLRKGHGYDGDQEMVKDEAKIKQLRKAAEPGRTV